MADWQELIDECGRSFGNPPRNFGLFEGKYLRLTEPPWLVKNQGDGLWTLFNAREKLYRTGVVTWAHIVQANELLFKPGQASCPALVVFNVKPSEPVYPPALRVIARQIFDLKSTTPDDPELARIAADITDELSRKYGLRVPAKITAGLPCQMSTTFVERKHIPGGYLRSSAIPGVLSPDGRGLILPLPGKYWPKAFSQAFQAGFQA